jgi:peptide/nickel transport system permease protein
MRYALQRFVQLIVVFVIVTFAVLVVMRIGAGSPTELAYKLLGGQPTPEQAAAAVETYHLDQNLVVQYLYWLRDLLFHRDLGFSARDNLPVSELLAPRVMTTVLLGIYAVVGAVALAIPVGIWSAYRRSQWFDHTAGALSFVGVAVPAIVLGVLLKLLFVVRLDWFPSIGTKVYPWDDPWEHFRNFFLPAMTLMLPLAAVYTRLLRADMVLTLQSDFITLATAKGAPPRRVLWRHALRNSLFSIVTAVGTQLGALIGSALVVEVLFDLDGLGSQLVTSVLTSDLFTVQSMVAVVVAIVVVVNMLVDLLYAVIDPRIRDVRALG